MKKKNRYSDITHKRKTTSPRSSRSNRTIQEIYISNEMESISAVSLAKKLDQIVPDIINNNENLNCPDLKDFDLNQIQNIEEVKSTREMLSKKIKNFDDGGRTAINYDNAAIAGAKLTVDERPATRMLIKKLVEKTDVHENSLLYNPLPLHKRETEAAKVIWGFRQDSIIESYVDFHKQLKFKKNILEHLDKKVNQEAPKRRNSAAARLNSKVTPTKKSLRKAFTNVNRTPKKTKKPNPLSFTGIMDNYADMIASEIKQQSTIIKRFKPIPLNFDVEDTGY